MDARRLPPSWGGPPFHYLLDFSLRSARTRARVSAAAAAAAAAFWLFGMHRQRMAALPS